MAELIRGRYEPLEVAGSGGQGEVLRARDRQLGREVAIKVRRPESDAGRESLLSEARVLLGLTPHTGLPLVREDFFEGSGYYLVTDWVEGTSLQSLLDEKGDPGLPVSTVIGYLERVADALDHLHAHTPPVVHRDVKPANIILTSDDRVVLVDFGISVRAGAADEQAMGTPGFTAPEVARGDAATTAADIYALGATAFALLTGKPPEGLLPEWEGVEQRQTGAIERALRRALATDPARRPRRSSDLVAQLRAHLLGHLPKGLVTLLVTEVEDSARLWDARPAEHVEAVERYMSAFAGLTEEHDGRVVGLGLEHDGARAAFERPEGALACVLALQRRLTDAPLRVRAALHTAQAEVRGGEYVGALVVRAAALRDIGHGAQILLSQAAADLARDRLPAGAGLIPLGAHRLKDLARPEEVFQLSHPDLPGEFPPLRSLETRRHNLPTQLTSMVGRENELAEVRALMMANRLVTLTGAGGCGKTRLALQAGAELLDDFSGGVWLVELAPLGDPALVAQAAAAAVGVREEPGRMLTDSLAERLRDATVAFLLDNCEHVVAACADLATRLLTACPGVRLLATSREPLAVPGEVTWRVPSLAVSLNGASTPEELERAPAIRLFVERAGLVRPGFGLTESNASAVAQVCRRLDGVPLAIELAAARVRTLSPEEIARRLDDRFGLLASGARGVLPRQQTLRAAVDWSHELLSEDERRMFARLAVFAGGFTLDAAEGVCADERIAGLGVLDLVTALADKSLLVADERGGETRYTMLETVREFAREKLRDLGEAPTLRAGHLAWFSSFVRDIEPQLHGAGQAAFLGRLEQEHDNLRVALGWGIEEAPSEEGLALAARLTRFWEVRGYPGEGRRWLESAVARVGQSREAVHAEALAGLGQLCLRQGDHERAQTALEEALPAARASGDEGLLAGVLDGFGDIALRRGNYERAESHFRESLAIARAAGNDAGVAGALQRLAIVAGGRGDFVSARARYAEALPVARALGDPRLVGMLLNSMALADVEQGDHAAARPLYEESLAIFRSIGDRYASGAVLVNLGWVRQKAGEPAEARALYEESLAIKRELGDREGIAVCLHDLATLARAEGNGAAAFALLRESLEIDMRLDDKRGIADGLEEFAKVLVDGGEHARAAELLGAAEALRERIGAPRAPDDRASYDDAVERARAALGGEAFRDAVEQGRVQRAEDIASSLITAGP